MPDAVVVIDIVGEGRADVGASRSRRGPTREFFPS